MFQRGHTILKVLGIDIVLAPSWIFIAALVTWTLSAHVFPDRFPDQVMTVHIAAGVASTLLFLASLILHELSHALVARRFGLNVPRITLFLLGGVAELADEPSSPQQEFAIALAGPVMSLALAALFWSAAEAVALTGMLEPAQVALGYLALLNLVLALFNLVPAFPLDGGRILRAVLWWTSGQLTSATRVAGMSGAIFAYALIGLGIYALLLGNVIGGVWQALLGLFILAAAKGTVQHQRIRTHLGDRTIADLMTTNPISVPPEMSLGELVNQVFLPNRISFAPVSDEENLMGYIDTAVISEIDREHWSSTQVGDVFVELDDDVVVEAEMRVADLLDRVRVSGRRKFIVAVGGRLRGVVTVADLTRYLSIASDLESRTLWRSTPAGT
ncbi:MAG: site-2 protease family protein [Pseudomonadota bacterium]